MACCDDCKSGVGGCASEMELDGLYGLSGLAGLMGELVAPGSIVRVGFAFEMANTDYGLNSEAQGFQNVAEALRQHLLEQGTFSAVQVSVNPPQYWGIQDGYITVQVTLTDGQSNPRNIGDAVQYKLSDHTLGVIVTKRDFERIDFVPPSEVGKPGVAQVTPQQATQTSPNQPQAPGACNWDTMSFGDYVSCQLGITSPIGGVSVGAFGALIAVGVGALVLVTVLKK